MFDRITLVDGLSQLELRSNISFFSGLGSRDMSLSIFSIGPSVQITK